MFKSKSETHFRHVNYEINIVTEMLGIKISGGTTFECFDPEAINPGVTTGNVVHITAKCITTV